MKRQPVLLMMAYGGPSSISEVEQYYTDIRRGHPPDPPQLKELQDRYTAIGGNSPLTQITLQQAKLLEERLNIKIYIGMKHWHPYIRETVEKISRSGATEVIAMVMAPHYSSMSIADYYNRLQRAVSEINPSLQITMIERWGDNQIFIDSLCERLEAGRQALASPKWDEIEVLFTAHSLPKRILSEGDPYQNELIQTASLAASKLHLPNWELVFQSAGRTSDEWIGPDILQVLRELANKGKKNVLVAPIGFTADNLEILYDLDIEATRVAKNLGLNFKRIPTANTSQLFIDALENIVRQFI